MRIPIPVTTNANQLTQYLNDRTMIDRKLKVVFSTYQSIDVVIEGLRQAERLHKFDLVICDEAHRTVGIDSKTDTKSPFIKIHYNELIPASKRLYFTATPRIYKERVRKKIEVGGSNCISMDDEDTFGSEFYNLSFAEAIEQGLLADYEVLIVQVSDKYLELFDTSKRAKILLNKEKGLDAGDAVKLIGLWDALSDPTTTEINYSRLPGTISIDHKYLKSAIAFSNSIANSKMRARVWRDLINLYQEKFAVASPNHFLDVVISHIDGKTSTNSREATLNSLANASSNQVCNIVNNVKVLGEGVDIPSLDAVIFFDSKTSKIDIVQSVGRAMRSYAGKEKGYIILPVVVESNSSINDEAVLESSEFKKVFSVIRALKAHDERVEYWVNNPKMSKSPFRVLRSEPQSDRKQKTGELEVRQMTLWSLPNVASKIVDKCGDRQMWPTWGNKAARICKDIEGYLIDTIADNEKSRYLFDEFYQSLSKTIKQDLEKEIVVEMLSQHIIIARIFKALFAETNFKNNPISKALDNIYQSLPQHIINYKLKPLEYAYRTMSSKIAENQSSKERVELLRKIYEGFLREAIPNIVRQLGIVYTPQPIVDKMLLLTNQLCQQEFSKSLADDNIHILEPFVGTGTFLYRLLTITLEGGQHLVPDTKFRRKFEHEIHGNELILLTYYVALVNITSAAFDRQIEVDGIFKNLVLANTFLYHSDQLSNKQLSYDITDDHNTQQFGRQATLPIKIIIGNPPWSAGKKSASDEFDLDLDYSHIKQRIQDTYVKKQQEIPERDSGGSATGNAYIQAIRWASDRLHDNNQSGGILVFVNPNSLLTANSLAGARAQLAEEFTDYIRD